MNNMITNKDVSVLELSQSKKVMMVFLRHFGCTFCREAMSDLFELREKIIDSNTELVIVHQLPESAGAQFLELYGLGNVHRISDPGKHLYDYFELKRGKAFQMFGPKVIARAIWAGLFKGHLVGPERGDGWQMPGVFIIYKGKVINSFVHKLSSDKPDYVALASTPAKANILAPRVQLT